MTNSDVDDTSFVKYGPLWTVILRVDVEDPLAGERSYIVAKARRG